VSGTPVETNPYHYADNDPLNKADALGLRPQDCSITGDALRAEADQIAGGEGGGRGGVNDRRRRAGNARALASVADGSNSCIIEYALGGDGEAVPAYGDLKSAQNILVMVPGTDTISGQDPDAGRVKERAGSRTAVVAWLGYNAPEIPWGLQSGARADAGAPRSADLIKAVGGGKRVSISGHSYGSLVAGQVGRRSGGETRQPDLHRQPWRAAGICFGFIACTGLGRRGRR
jgi:hypothetical protein